MAPTGAKRKVEGVNEAFFPGAPTPAIPAVDPADFREAMSRVAGAVHLVTTDGPAGKAGLTATAVTSVSDVPPTLLVCVNKASRTGAMIAANGRFAVSLLGENHRALADLFAGRTDVHGPARFGQGMWRADPLGQPALADALVAFACTSQAIDPVASHLVVFGAIRAIALGQGGAGLVYARRAYHAV